MTDFEFMVAMIVGCGLIMVLVVSVVASQMYNGRK